MSEDLQTEQEIQNICQELAEGNWSKYWSKNCFLIRPSGNPLYPEQEAEMRNSQDIVMTKEELISINKVSVYGDVATCCFTVHQVFSYKGTPNDDISVVLVVLKKEPQGWKMVTGSRSQGRSPSDTSPAFK